MKKLIFILIVGSLFTGCASISTQERETALVLENLNKNKDELFDLSWEWMAKTFRDSKSVIEVKDKAIGKIVGKGYMIVTTVMGRTGVTYILTIDIKDNRIRVKFEDYGYHDYSPIMQSDKRVLEKAKEASNEMVKDLEVFIKGSDEEDKW